MKISSLSNYLLACFPTDLKQILGMLPVIRNQTFDIHLERNNLFLKDHYNGLFTLEPSEDSVSHIKL